MPTFDTDTSDGVARDGATVFRMGAVGIVGAC